MACEKLTEVDTLLTADSVEWCPCGGLQQVLASGTYQLDENTGFRRGTLTMYEWNHSTSTLTKILEKDSSKMSDGILDMKWCTGSDEAVLALAEATGIVSFLHMEQKAGDYSLVETSRTWVVDMWTLDLALCLSLDWNKQNPSLVAVSDSQGYISIVERGCVSVPKRWRWKAHEFEVWIVVCGSDGHTIFSGGDDCRLCCWDTREDLTKPTFTSKKHTMGVCSLQVHPDLPHILTSGSYDQTMCVWDTRNMAKPLKDCNIGGGVWRIKWCPLNSDLAATACMHNGFQVVRGNLKSGDPPEVVSSYSEHKSLAYGIDWCQLPAPSKDHLTLASSSFYDHSLHIWRCKNVLSQ